MSIQLTLCLGSVVSLLLLCGLLCMLGTRTKFTLNEKFPPPGEMIDMGGYRLHINCQGEKSKNTIPAVVMEAADFSLSWALVQPEVARFTETCAYDRAGLGWSERSPKPRTASNIVDELHTLLNRASIKPPYILVGHSKGGLFVRLYAHTYPHEVAGIVLVDSAHEEQEERFPKSIRLSNQKSRKQTIGILTIIKRLNSIGLITSLLVRFSNLLLGTIPENVREMSLGRVLSDRFFDTVIEETQALDGHFKEIRTANIETLGDIPLIVLTASDQFDALEKQIPMEDLAKLKEVVNELQTELTNLSSKGKLVKVTESGHHIHVDQPQAVIDAIREIIEIVQI